MCPLSSSRVCTAFFRLAIWTSNRFEQLKVHLLRCVWILSYAIRNATVHSPLQIYSLEERINCLQEKWHFKPSLFAIYNRKLCHFYKRLISCSTSYKWHNHFKADQRVKNYTKQTSRETSDYGVDSGRIVNVTERANCVRLYCSRR